MRIPRNLCDLCAYIKVLKFQRGGFKSSEEREPRTGVECWRNQARIYIQIVCIQPTTGVASKLKSLITVASQLRVASPYTSRIPSAVLAQHSQLDPPYSNIAIRQHTFKCQTVVPRLSFITFVLHLCVRSSATESLRTRTHLSNRASQDVGAGRLGRMIEKTRQHYHII